MFVAEVEFVVGRTGQQVIKEFTLVENVFSGGVNVLIHTLVNPPCAWGSLSRRRQLTNIWLQENQHGLNFWWGRHTLDEVKEEMAQYMPSQGHVLFTKGEEKASVLEDVFGYPTLDVVAAPKSVGGSLRVDCPFEHSPIFCSKRKAILLTRWMKENPEYVTF